MTIPGGLSGEASAPSPAAPAQPSSAPGGGKKKLYIMTLGCLAPYRRLGVGSKMVEHVLSIVEKDGSFESVFLHVQVRDSSMLFPITLRLVPLHYVYVFNGKRFKISLPN